MTTNGKSLKTQSLIRRAAAPGLGLVLLAISQPALAFDAADADALSHFVGDAAQALGEAGETLRELKSGEFADVRGRVARGAVKAKWNAATAPLRNSSAALRKSLPYKVAPTLFTISDTITSVLAPAIEGDYRGAMGNAANLAVAPTASGAGASLFGAVGTGIGATIGSFIPVVGTVAGGMVGGAIGTFAGGFVAASAYDRYVKDNLAGGLEAGIAALFDETPRQQAMDARHAFLYDTGADDIRTYWDNLRATGLSPDEVELIGPELSPDIAVPKEPVPSALPPAAPVADGPLAGVRKFSIGPEVWTIEDGVATFRMEYPGPVHTVLTGRGTVSGDRIEGTMTWVHGGDDGGCVVRETERFVFTFEATTVSGVNQPGPVELLSDACGDGWAKMTHGASWSDVPWEVIE